jgi:type I restriction enzyme S subunit
MEKQLPKNWITVSLQDVTKNVKGKKPQIQSEIEFQSSIPYMDIKALEYNTIRQFADIKSSKLFEEGDVAMVWDGARSGWVSKTNFGAIGSTIVAFKPIIINSDYLFYYLLDKYPFINSNARGVGIPHVDPTILWALNFPLPPLPEQQRIVAKLDMFFAQLETIKTSMANIPLLLKDFRQQVLTQAVTGKLTEEWRKGKELNEWQESPLSDFSDARLGKMLDNAKNSGELVSYLGNINVRWSEIDFSDLKQMKVEPKELHKYELLKGDILVCEGGEPGRAAIWKYNRNDVIFQKALHRIRLNENVLPDFFLYNLKIDSQNNKLEQLFTGTTIKHLTGRSFSTYTILIPETKEQQEIVRRVENLFAKADAIEQQYKTLKASIDTLPQALLHKAFKGELSEQLDTDGDARELLKQIQELKKSAVKPKKATTKKVKNYPENKEVLGMVAEEHYKK